MKALLRRPHSVESQILSRIQTAGRGSVFVPSDFLDLGNRQSVDFALHRLVKRQELRRLTRGLYDYPRRHPELGLLSPTIEAVTQALAGRDQLRLQPSGAYAANMLHLSEQVPAKVEFLTDGPSRRIQIGARVIVLKQTTPKAMATAGRISGLVIQALKYLGQKHVTLERIAPLRQLLKASDRKQLSKDVALAPAWMHPFLRAVAEDEVRA